MIHLASLFLVPLRPHCAVEPPTLKFITTPDGSQPHVTKVMSAAGSCAGSERLLNLASTFVPVISCAALTVEKNPNLLVPALRWSQGLRGRAPLQFLGENVYSHLNPETQ